MAGKEKKTVKEDDVNLAISLLTQLTVLVNKSNVKSNPVVRSLLQGLDNKNEDFKTANLVISTLRNAGCVINANQNSGEKSEKSVKSKKEVPKGQPTSKDSEESPKKLRGFTRSIDYLLAGSYFTESHPAILSLRKLREDKERVIKIEKNDGTVVDRKISAIDDFDLLYLEDLNNYERIMETLGDYENPEVADSGYFQVPYEMWNTTGKAKGFITAVAEKISDKKENLIFQENALGEYSSLARVLKGSVMNKILQFLKDSTIPKGFKAPQGAEEVALYKMIVNTLIGEKWFKFGKSPTLSRVVAY